MSRLVAAIFDEFLEAASDPEGGVRLHGLHAPDAILPTIARPCPASMVDIAEFARRHRQVVADGAGHLPQLARTKYLGQSAQAPHSDCVAWFLVEDQRSPGKHLHAAVGLRALPHGYRIGWSTLSLSPASWTYSTGLLQSLANLAWLAPTSGTPCRSLLDAAFMHLYALDSIAFLTLPNARFSCHMSTTCCRNDFAITLPPEAQLIVDAIPWATLKPSLANTQLEMRRDGMLQLKHPDERCRFLGTDKRCLIHQAVGRQPFGPCAMFPFKFAWTPEGISVATSSVCPSARAGLGIPISARRPDLLDRLAHHHMQPPRSFRLDPDTEIEWPMFRDLEAAILQVLDNDDLPLRQRLYSGLRILEGVSPRPAQLEPWTESSAAPYGILPELRATLRAMLSQIFEWNRPVLRSITSGIPDDLSEREILHHRQFAQVLQNTWFSKVYSYRFDLITAFNLLIVLYLVALTMEAAAKPGLSESMWEELGALGVHGLLSTLLDRDDRLDQFRALFGTVDFGAWLLVA